MRITALILAGGQSRRLGGGDKALITLDGTRIIDRVAARLAPQVQALWLNANGDAARFALDLPVVPDTVPGAPGPLAGILAGMDGLAPDDLLLTVPADCPFLPRDLAARLLAALGPHPAAIARSGGRSQPVVGLWPARAREHLRAMLVRDGEKRVGRWAERAGAVAVEWPAEPFDPFFNINTPADVGEAERLLAAYPAL